MMQMQWTSLSDFLNMGGYALYVWGSFGATALCMVVEPLLLRQRRQASRRHLLAQWRAQEGK
jgi:heme exporter protein D